MYRWPSVLFMLIFCLFITGSAFAVSKKIPARIQTDTSTIHIKKFDATAIKHFKADKDFNYKGQAVNVNQLSLWDRFWDWIWRKIYGLLFGPTSQGYFTRYLLLGISIVFLVYVILKSLGVDPIRLWRGDAKKVGVDYTESLENIYEINFDSEIEKAISQHNYRLAVRLLYLKCLKQLSDSQLIQWQIDKTNNAYLFELKDPAQKQTFSLLTRQFEYVWYGDFIIDKQAFGNINQLFQNFKKQLP